MLIQFELFLMFKKKMVKCDLTRIVKEIITQNLKLY